MKDMFTKDEVVSMLKQMQVDTAECIGFFVGTVTQAWVIETLLGEKIQELGGESIEIDYV